MKKNKFYYLCFVLLFLQVSLFAEGDKEITAIGNILSSSKSLISTQVDGRVEKIFIEIGDVVKKGQPLIQLDKRFCEIDLAQKLAILDSVKVEMEDAEKNFLRMQKLWEKPSGENPSIPLKRYEDAKSKFDQIAAKYKQELENVKRARLNLEETTIKSPYNGIITQKFVDIGESIPVQPVTNLIEIQSTHPLYLEFSIPQMYASQLHLGSPLHFEIDGMKIENTEAKIDLFYPILDESTRSLRCRAIISNQDFKIRPGSLVRVKIKTQE